MTATPLQAGSVVAVASVPSPPLLLPGATGHPVAEVEQLRAGCLSAIERICGAVERVVLVGAAAPVWDGGLPLAECVGRSLLIAALGPEQAARRVESLFLSPGAPAVECIDLGRQLACRDERLGLLVMADGSACRSVKAPGYLDERAAGFDQQIVDALRTADTSALAMLDERMSAELLVAGRAAWQVLSGAIEAGPRPDVVEHYLGDPFGVLYPVFSFLR